MTNHALLIVDMQKAYFRNEDLANKQESLLKNSNNLIKFFELHNLPIFTIVTRHKRDQSTWTLNMKEDDQGYLFSGEDETSLIDGLLAAKTHEVIKTRDSAFFDTNLVTVLRNLNIDTLIISGVSTHSCILLTAADAYAHDFKVILAIDAIASHDHSYHDSTLKMLEQEYRQLLYSNDEIISTISNKKNEM